jgi:hypothetical protein
VTVRHPLPVVVTPRLASTRSPPRARRIYAAPRGVTPLRLAGDGSGRVIETAACGPSVCLESVAAGGGLSRVGALVRFGP